MKKLWMLITALALTACSQVHQTDIIKGNNGDDGYTIVMKAEASTLCLNGGQRLLFGLDTNRSGIYDAGDTPQQDINICNGAPGQPGLSASTDVEHPGANCPTGGVKVSVDSTVNYVCNGAVGATGAVGPQGPAGVAGQDAEVVKISSVKVTASCGYVNGVGTEGVWVRFWVDRDNDTYISSGEVLSSYTVCNGKNVALSDAPTSQCPNGGIKLDVPGSTKYVCNGTNGLNGENGAQGLQGPQGAPGQNGDDGSNGTNGKSAYELAVENGFTGTLTQWLTSLNGDDGLQGPAGPIGPQGPSGSAGVGSLQMILLAPSCSGNKEYGIVTGGKVYAVYHQELSSGKSNTYLAQLAPGTYVTTDGSNCQFTVTYNTDNTVTVGGVTYGSSTLLLTIDSASNNSNSYTVKMRVKNTGSVTTGAFSISFDIPSDVTSISCSGSVNNPTLVRSGNRVTIKPDGDHTYWVLSPQEVSQDITCQVGRPFQHNVSDYQNPNFTNGSAALL